MTTENQAPEGGDCAAELRVIGDALLAAHDHLEMHKLERSHCNSAAAIGAGLATYSAWKKRPDLITPAPAEGDELPKVPNYVLACIHAYGDARADDDGTSANHLRHAIEEMRKWAGTLAAPNVQPKGTELVAWRDVKTGEPLQPGDRYADAHGWTVIGDEQFRVMTANGRAWTQEERSKPTQRRVTVPAAQAPAPAPEVAARLHEIGSWDHHGDSVEDACDERFGPGSWAAIMAAVRAPAVGAEAECETWRALCEFLLQADEPMAFLRAWNEGNFDACKREWPEAPAGVYPASHPPVQHQGDAP